MVNSGTEATMSCIRLARGTTNKKKIIKFIGCYHGHVDSLLVKAGSGLATLGVPDSPGIPEELSQLTISLPYNDISALERAFKEYNHDIAAVIIEPIAGNMGFIPADKSFLELLRKTTKANKSLLIFDEVQCGIGRTGNWFAFQKAGIKPDVLTLAKGLGSGVPIGALVVKEKYADILGPGDHGSTFGGNPLAMQAGLTTLNIIEEERLLENARNRGDQIVKCLKRELKNYPDVVSIRGVGLMIGIQLRVDCSQITKIALDNGLLVNVTNSNVIRLLPPLIISHKEVEILLAKLVFSIKTFFEK